MPPACRRMSRSLPAGTRAWPRSLDRLRRAGSRPCSRRGFISPETQKIAWDSMSGGSSTEADTLEQLEAGFSLPRNIHRKDTTMDLLAFAKAIADRVEA